MMYDNKTHYNTDVNNTILIMYFTQDTQIDAITKMFSK